jgi:hypothetical protein
MDIYLRISVGLEISLREEKKFTYVIKKTNQFSSVSRILGGLLVSTCPCQAQTKTSIVNGR